MISRPPASDTPPPRMTSSGSRMAATEARPSPIHAPRSASSSTAAGSPSTAALVTSGPLSAAGSPAHSSPRRAACGVPEMTSSRASRTRALPLAYCSQQPRLPQPQRIPFGTTRTWPSSAATPNAPRMRSPPATMPPPMPVPTVTITMSSAPAATPKRNSPQVAALASFSRVTGRSRTDSRCRLNGSSRHARFGAKSTLDPERSMKPAQAMPTASIEHSRDSSRTRSATSRAMAAGSWAGVSLRPLARITPLPSMTPPLILVPPMSSPIVALTYVNLRFRHLQECPGP